MIIYNYNAGLEESILNSNFKKLFKNVYADVCFIFEEYSTDRLVICHFLLPAKLSQYVAIDINGRRLILLLLCVLVFILYNFDAILHFGRKFKNFIDDQTIVIGIECGFFFHMNKKIYISTESRGLISFGLVKTKCKNMYS